MKGKIIGYRFGGTEEPYIVPVTESDDPVEATKQKQYIKSFPGAGLVVGMLRDLDLRDAAATTPDSATDEITRKIGFALWSAEMVVSMNPKGFVITTEDGSAFQLTIERTEA